MISSTSLNSRTLRFGLGAMMSLLFLAIYFPTSTYAKTKKAKYGTIKILSNPGGLALTIDGKFYGETRTEYRAFDLDAGLHRVAIKMPNGRLWTREIELPSGRIKCVAVNYRPLPPLPKSPCPFPLNVSAPSQADEGEIITYGSDVSYSGSGPLKYDWSISPASAHIIGGLGTPTLAVDSTGLAGKQITATLKVSDGSGEPLCQQSAQAFTMI